MKKAPEAFRTISEVSEILDTPAHVLRFWESKFYQIRPVKRAGGRRYYRPDDLALLAGIRLLLQDQGMTIRGVQKILQEQGIKHVSSLAAELAADVDDVDDGLDEVAGFHEAPETGQADAQGGADEASEDRATPASRAGSAPPPLRVVPARPPAPLPLPLDDAPQPVPAPQAAEPIGQPAPPAMPAPQESAAFDEAETPAEPAEAPPPPPLDPPAGKPPGGAGIPAPDLSDLALDIAAESGTERPARRLRALPRHRLEAHHDQIVLLARRIDALLDRMSDASGAGRW